MSPHRLFLSADRRGTSLHQMSARAELPSRRVRGAFQALRLPARAVNHGIESHDRHGETCNARAVRLYGRILTSGGAFATAIRDGQGDDEPALLVALMTLTRERASV